MSSLNAITQAVTNVTVLQLGNVLQGKEVGGLFIGHFFILFSLHSADCWLGSGAVLISLLYQGQLPYLLNSILYVQYCFPPLLLFKMLMLFISLFCQKRLLGEQLGPTRVIDTN